MSKIYVDEIAGIASANTVAIPGHVIQTVTSVSNSQFALTSTSWTGTNFSVNITPSSTSSKILIILLGGMADNEPTRQTQFTLFRNDSVNLGTDARGISQSYTATGRQQVPISFGIVDEPSSTTSTNYEIYMKANVTDAVYLNTDGCRMTLMAMEIAG